MSKKWTEPKGKTSIGSNRETEPKIDDNIMFEPNGHTYKLTDFIVAPYKRDKKGRHVVTGYLLTKGNSTIVASQDEIRW